jgi:hypothetical protein
MQHHHAPVLGQERLFRLSAKFKRELRQALEGKNLQSSITLQFLIRQKLALQLEGGLLGREQEEGRPIRFRQESLANFRQAAESLPRPSRSEQKARMHNVLVAQNLPGEKNFS